MYYVHMTGHGGMTLVELDPQASETRQPYGIITVDCSNPKEFDDGISVTRLDAATEMYRVGVYAVDTSALYDDGSIVKQVLERTESKYAGTDPHDSRSYIPMLSEEMVKDHDFRTGNIRNALQVSFVIGVNTPPSELAITFGKVQINRNFNYKRFGNKCRYDEKYDKYGRAAALILKHFNINDSSEEEEEDNYKHLIHVPSTHGWKRGNRLNSIYMIGGNTILGDISDHDNDLAIYRIHSLGNSAMTDILAPDVAYYSTTPGPHEGLGQHRYVRFTSPLRRSEDFVMHGLLKAKASGRILNSRDYKITTTAVRRLNQRIAAQAFEDRPRLDSQSVWGRGRRQVDLAG